MVGHGFPQIRQRADGIGQRLADIGEAGLDIAGAARRGEILGLRRAVVTLRRLSCRMRIDKIRCVGRSRGAPIPAACISSAEVLPGVSGCSTFLWHRAAISH